MKKMFRRNFLPKHCTEWACLLLTAVFIPLYYIFDLYYVMPFYYKPNTTWYWIHFTAGNFLMVNIVGNLMGVILVDTSVANMSSLSSDTAIIVKEKSSQWMYCEMCKTFMPPRCWHCDTCDRCILKRDHHCTFVGYCIGHFNHRYFLMFITYIFIASCYACYINLHYVLPRISVWDITLFFQIFTPIVILMMDLRRLESCLLVTILIMNMIFLALSGIFTIYHWPLVYNGTVVHEKLKKNRLYDYGPRTNLRMVLGEKWYVAWLSPFIRSPLTTDGINWPENKTKRM